MDSSNQRRRMSDVLTLAIYSYATKQNFIMCIKGQYIPNLCLTCNSLMLSGCIKGQYIPNLCLACNSLILSGWSRRKKENKMKSFIKYTKCV